MLIPHSVDISMSITSLTLPLSLSPSLSLSLSLSPSLSPSPFSPPSSFLFLPRLSDVYHLVFNPPKSADIADRLTEEPGGIEKNMHSKLTHYHHHSNHVLSCYHNVAKKFNADQPIQDLFTQSECVTKLSLFLLTN